jgi:hypothetical protein
LIREPLFEGRNALRKHWLPFAGLGHCATDRATL